MPFARCIPFVDSLLLALIAGTLHGAGAEPPRTDLYGDPLPSGAVMRLGTVRLRHANALFTFSADGKQLISFDPDGEIRVWQVATGKLIRSKWLWRPKQDFRYHAVAIRDWHFLRYSIALAPNGTTAVARREDAIFLYDTATGDLRRRLPIDASDKNESLEFSLSPDGKLLTVVRQPEGKAELTIQLWEVATGKLRQSFNLSKTHSRPVAFSSDGRYVLGELDKVGEMHVWDTSTGKELDRFKGGVTSIPVFSPDNETLAAGVGGLKVQLWDTTGRRKKTVLDVSGDAGTDCTFRSIAFSRDARFLAGVYDNSRSDKPKEGIVIWDLASGREVRRLPERMGWWLALAPDGKTLACAGWDNEIRLWDVASGRQLHLRPGHYSPVRRLAVSSNGRILASAASRLRLWDTATGMQLRVFEDAAGEVLISPDGKRVIAANKPRNNEERFFVWDVVTGKELRRFSITQPPSATAFSPVKTLGLSTDGKRLTAVGWDDFTRATQVYHWEIDSGRLLSQRSYPDENAIRLAVSPDGERLCLRRERKMSIEEARTGRQLRTLPESVGGLVVFSQDGRFLAAPNWQPRKNPAEGSDWKGLSLIETASGKEVLRLQTTEMHLLAFTADGRGLVGVDKEALHVWDVATGKLLHQMMWPASILEQQEQFDTGVRSLVLLPGGRAVTGLNDGTILIWDLAVKSWPAHGLARDLTVDALMKLWADLASEAATAHRALHTLASSSTPVLPFLSERILPSAAAEAKRIETLLADLDSNEFNTREAATRELIQLREWIEPTLRRMLENKPSPEVRRRVQAILTAAITSPSISVETLRRLRAIAVLERIGTPEARRILKKLAVGAATPEAQEAKAALQRLNHRNPWANGGSTP